MIYPMLMRVDSDQGCRLHVVTQTTNGFPDCINFERLGTGTTISFVAAVLDIDQIPFTSKAQP